MSWFALSHGFAEPTDQTSIWTPVRLPRQPHQPHQPQQQQRPARSLGSSNADNRWRWVSPATSQTTTAVVERKDYDRDVSDGREPVATRLVVAHELRSEMAQMAQTLGRSEDDIWAEAAREWLMRRLRNDEPPPTTPAAAPVANVRTHRLWSEIDVMLAELRHPRYVATPAEPAIPAA